MGPTRGEFVLGAAVLMLAALLSGCDGGAPRANPNVLFVLSDSHRASALGCYGQTKVRTPNLDAFAEQGLRLTAAVSSTPQCRPYRASLMTGSFSHHTGLLSNKSRRNHVDENALWYPDGPPTLGEAFASAGYRCGYVGKWHLGAVKIDPGPERLGFDDYWVVGHHGNLHYYFDWIYATGAETSISGKGSYRTTLETDLAIEFIEASGEEPWLLVLSWGPPHGEFDESLPGLPEYDPIEPPPNVPIQYEYLAEYKELPKYFSMIESIDIEFARLLDALQRAGVADDTIVIYTSDHGELRWSHGAMGKELPYSGSTQVPFLIRWPGHIEPGSTLGMPFGTPDIFPSLTGLAGLDLPTGIDGADYSGALRGDQDAPRQAAAYLNAHAAQGIGWPGWRGVRTERHLYARKEAGPWLLFDLQEDPFELRDLVDEAPELRDELDAMTLELMDRYGDTWRGMEVRR